MQNNKLRGRNQTSPTKMVIQRKVNAGKGYEDLKQPVLDTKKIPPVKLLDKRKIFQTILKFVAQMPIFSFFVLECLVTNIVIIWLLLILSPVICVYNMLKFIESKWVFYHTGAIPMSGQDALWLQDNKENRLIINSVMVLAGDAPGVVEGIKGIIKRCMLMKNKAGGLAFPRLTKCIVKGTFQYLLEESTSFNLDDHVYEYEGESPKSYEEMRQLLSRLSGEDLTFDKPSWRFISIRKAYDENEIVVLFRAHHGLADGISLTKFVLLLFSDQNLMEGKIIKFSNVDRMLMSVKALLVGSRMLVYKFLQSPDKSIIHGPQLSGVKKVAWSRPIDLQLIKRIKNKTRTTVNDVLMTCISMSFQDYFRSKGVLNAPDITASVPVDIRAPDVDIVLENNFSIVSLKLPVSKTTMDDQLHTTKARMDEIKHSGEAFFMGTAANVTVQNLPEFITNLWNKPIANKHTLVLSNVPGPSTPFTMSGYPVKEIYFWPPQRDQVGIGVGVYSYAGKVSIGVEGDENCLPDPQAIVNGFKAKLKELDVHVNKSETDGDSGIDLK